MNSHVFITTAANTCARCPRPIDAGVKAVLNEHGVVHLGCDEPSTPAPRRTRRRESAVCRDCWTIHEGKCG